ncbi:hypothetical protein EDB81DRAFT_636820 [Dactylonectria macrodidyma]|uniref:BTB domain-containing protein n=1 Tax=Dactylonectria macrodidyma TaxID=307937 RepID=A0A9P9FSR5_9HYPO|nr:hypothetical protein EDB81DRAFT_636820 [Dactylonectria macrodidyma]
MVPIMRPSSFERMAEDSKGSRASASRPTTTYKMAPTAPPPGPLSTVLIGPKQQRFKVNKRLLCASASFFSERLQDPPHGKPISLWLPRESASMFALYVEWVHLGSRFRHYIDDAVIHARETGEQHLRDFHWAMIRLHLFASHLALHRLQDLVMDAVQDLYLRRDWDVPPSLINFLYTECEDLAAIRLRRWAVAMVAFSFNGGPHMDFNTQESTDAEPTRFSDLLDQLPEFSADYDLHMRKMRESGLDIRFKNPQLRIPANRLRNDERAFGFRQCSFHSHRATVGERRCPHDGGASAKFHRIHPSITARGSMVAGLSTPSRRNHDIVPPPLFSGRLDEEDEGEGDVEDEISKAIKHVRSISSTLKT